MSQVPPQIQRQEPPAIGERRARWGYGYQDKIATERILNILRKDLRERDTLFEGVRLADLDAGRADDFVLVWEKEVEGNSIKWSGEATPLNWGEIIGANGLLKELADGYQRLKDRWPAKAVSVRLQSNRPPSSEKHHAQLISTFSVAEFVRDHWPSGPTAHDSAQVTAVWSKISEHVGLTGSDFSEFVNSCNLSLGYPEPPGSGPDSQGWRHYKKQFGDLHKAIATWLTNNPHSDFIDRFFLLSAIGFRGSRSGLIQRFPLPKIPYSKNGTSADQLKQLIDTTEGGYIAVVGPAGIGKSTLVQDVLSDAQYPFFIPYYAFLPDTDGNRDRGEALTFFQDVIGRLDKFFTHRYSLGISDVAQGREALREHMSKANEQYIIQGHKTILLIDGLDHVSREINLQNPLLQELPSPDEVPDGFLIILSSQPQALIPGTITASVGNVVAPQSDRRIEVSGLTRPEVHAILEKIDKATTGSEHDALYNASLGNPLILTYLLNLFQRTSETTVDEAVALAGNYAGDIEGYYQSALAIPLQDAQTRQLLGLLCRAAPTIPVKWLQEWPERVQLENIYERILAPFVQVEDGNLQFIHNSLIAFLKSGTRSRLPGADLNADERNFHSTLADRCGNRPCVDPLGRARVLHLQRANRNNDLLSVLSSDWLRQAIEEFLPYALIRPLLLSGLEAAWNLGDLGQVLRLILLSHELGQRTSRMEAGDLAETLLGLDKPELAVSQVRAVGRLLVEDSVALVFAHSLWIYADDHNRPELKNTARTLYLQAKPVSFFYQNEPIDTWHQQEYNSVLRAWSDTAPLFEDCGSIVAQIKRLRFKVHDYGEKVDEAGVKASLLYGALLTVMDFESGIDDCQMLLDEIKGLGQTTWLFAALLNLARWNLLHVSSDNLETAYGESERNDDIDLAYAKVLYRQGDSKGAKEIVKRLSHIRFDGIRNNHSFGFSDISYTVTLRCLQELLNIPEGSVPDVNDDSEEAYARIETTARKIGALFAAVKRRKVIPNLNIAMRSLLLFHNQAVAFPEFDWRNNYIVTQSKKGIYRQIVRIAVAIGKEGLESLRDILLELVNGPAGAQFAAHNRRYFAEELFHNGVLSKEQAVELGLSSTLDAKDEDPMQRQEACFEIATFLHTVGEDMLSLQWLKRAGEVSAGAGSHKDYHMSHLAEWLSRSVGDGLDAGKLSILEKFARAVKVAGGDGASEAAGRELQLVVQLEPISASRFAIELIDRDVLNVSQTLEALMLGSAKAGASAELLVALYNELLSLIGLGDTSEVAVGILRSFPIEKRIEAAKAMMDCVRTNSLPSHRIEIARAIQDALREDGLGENVLTQGLNPGRDDSSRKSSLYRRPTGEMETTDQVAVRLSNPDNPEEWNPNPTENGDFYWWSAVKKAKIRDMSHLNDLLSSFPPPDYRESDLLAWKSERLLEIGDRETAKLLAEQAIDSARDGSWHSWLDGAQKKIAYSALKRIDKNESLPRARAQFGEDLAAGKLNSSYLLYDILETLDFLELDWPSEDVCGIIDDYLVHVLAANQEISPFDSLIEASEEGSADEALCRVLVHLLAFPVVDVGAGARRALARYAATDGNGVVAIVSREPCWDSVQLEHILASLHAGSRSNNVTVNNLRDWIQNLNKHESIAVRGIARRVCEEQGWPWKEINDQDKQPVILLSESLTSPTDYEEARMLVGGDIATALQLHRGIFARLEKAGLDADELRSEFYRLFRKIEKDYSWAEENRLKRWMKLVLARHWLNPRVIVGREAAMRVLGRRSLTGQAPSGAEQSYDYLYPIYDSKLELLQPIERPVELHAMEWRLWDDQGEAWLRGENADSWSYYPESINGLYIIGERTWFIRPDWEWPREERRRGLVVGPCDSDQTQECIQTSQEITFESYLRGEGQGDEQLIVLNSERQFIGPAYRWAAINSSFARRLGWHPSDDEPFEWVDSSGNLMVKSVYWRDGWIWLEPPRFESLGEGWLVLSTEQGVKSIREASNNFELHLWVERHSHGEKSYEGKWHLSKSI
ncbi:MAG: hypothetical protein ISS66_19110 [Desulfobacteraceae bacterium]|nr:hypothetical protein [Desulfobacteraceae bacterium]